MDGAIERRLAKECDAGFRTDAERAKISELCGILSSDAGDGDGLTVGGLRKAGGVLWLDGSIFGRNGIAVGISHGIAEQGGNFILELLRDVMLEFFSLGVDFVP